MEMQLCLPVKGSSEDQGIVGADLVKAGVVEVLVVDQATGLVDDDERKDGPRLELVFGVRAPIYKTSYMAALTFGFVHTNFQYSVQLPISSSTWPLSLTQPSMSDHELL